jgi:outer membrane protein assembly factor BamB
LLDRVAMRTPSATSLALALLAGCAAPGDGALGPDGGGEAEADPDPGGPPDEVLWVHRYAMQVEFAPALSPDGTIVVQGRSSIDTPEGGPTVLALDRRGELRWSASTEPGAVPAPAASLHDGVVLVPATVSGSPLGGRLYRFQLADGQALPSIELSGPVTDGLAVAADGTVYAPATPLQAVADEKVQWSYAMVADGKTGSNPAIGPSGTIYVGARGLNDHNLHAVTPAGTERWKRDVGSAIIDPIAIDDEERIYALNSKGRLVAYDADGTLAWSLQLDSGSSGGGIVVGPDRTVYLGTIGKSPGVYTGEYLYAARQGDDGQGELVWQAKVGMSWIGTTPALSESGTLYVSDFCRGLMAVRASDGQELWRYEIPELGENQCASFGSPALGADGRIYAWNGGLVGGAGAGLYAFRGDGAGPADSPWPQEGGDPTHQGRVDGDRR